MSRYSIRFALVGNRVYKHVDGGGCGSCHLKNDVEDCHSVRTGSCDGGRYVICKKKKPLTKKESRIKRSLRYQSKFSIRKSKVTICPSRTMYV